VAGAIVEGQPQMGWLGVSARRRQTISMELGRVLNAEQSLELPAGVPFTTRLLTFTRRAPAHQDTAASVHILAATENRPAKPAHQRDSERMALLAARQRVMADAGASTRTTDRESILCSPGSLLQRAS